MTNRSEELRIATPLESMLCEGVGMAKMNWDRVGREQRLWRFLNSDEEDSPRDGAEADQTPQESVDIPIVRAGTLCTCCSRPFVDGDAYYLTRTNNPRHHPVCPGGR